MRAADLGFGHLDGDVGRQRTHAFEDTHVHHRGITRRHEYDHGLADSAPEEWTPHMQWTTTGPFPGDFTA